MKRVEGHRSQIDASLVFTNVPRTSKLAPTNDSREDRELLLASRKGEGGFGLFYRRHRDAVLAFHTSRVRDGELAADLTAETFAAALLAVHNPEREAPDTPVAWLFAIAHRKLIDSFRRGRVEERARRQLELEPLQLDDEDLQQIERIGRDTDVASQLAQTLPPEQLHALTARVLEERDYADIARELRCSQSVVRKRVSRALNNLRAGLEETR